MKPCFNRAVRGLLTATMLLATVSLTAQEAKQKMTYFEGYLTRLGPSTEHSTLYSVGGDLLIGVIAESNVHTGLGVGFRRETAAGWYSRFALMNLSFREADLRVVEFSPFTSLITNGERTRTLNGYIRLERGRYFRISDRFQLGLGFILDPHFLVARIEPALPQDDPIRFHQAALSAGINPSASFSLSDRTRLLVEIPWPVATLSISSIKYDSPFIFEEQRTDTRGQFDAFDRIQASLGLQVRL